jgi:DNA invertase Pin-like site-specific DNA recombinase
MSCRSTQMIIGYARVLTRDQNLDLQRDALSRTGAERLFEDEASGARDDRPGLADALSHLRQGDCLIVWRLDRLGRTMRSLIGFVEDLRERGIDFRSVTEGIDTTTPAGRFFLRRLMRATYLLPISQRCWATSRLGL